MALHGRRGPTVLAGEREKPSRPVRVLLRRMINYLGQFKRIVAIGALFSLMGTIVAVLDPLILSWGIDAAFDTQTTYLTILWLVGLYIAFKLISWIFSSINTWILADAQAGFVQNVQHDVYDNLIRADLSYHKSEQSGNVTSRVTTDTVDLATGIQVIIDFTSQVLMLVSAFLLLWWVAPLLALTSLVIVPGVAFIAWLFGTVGQRIMLASQRAYGRVSGQIAENLSGIHIAKAFNREDELAEEMMDLNQKAYRHGFRFMMLMSAMQPLVRSIGQFALAAMLFVAGSLATGTASSLTIGQVFLSIILISRFLWPLLALTMMATQVQASLAAMDRVSDILESESTIVDSVEAAPLSTESDGISFENVTFEYIENTPVLKDVSFEITPGQTVAVVGHTGAGKTTLAALINRFYDPNEGSIRIGEQDLRYVTLDSLRDTISLIPQEPYLFDDTILENIRYGKPDASIDEIIELCKLIGANEFIEVLADGYDTKIIEGGKNLSAGQKQMITIARTMLADPKILILDEATSRLDAYSESLVQDAQALLFAERTTVVIAHRLTTIADASRVFVFENGELIEQGTHRELLELGGVFKSLYDTYYAHQGVEEITEETAAHAAEVYKEAPAEAVTHIGGIGSGSMMGMDGHSERLTPEMIERIKKNPELIPKEHRERILEMITKREKRE